ncbi:hypothetical protein GCM10023200_17400 [Actinomycetospora chlora]|uniref:Uncharacterized protein n=1 Tax=Actinomycetospora chlora TaxID=663608 RepID=A0ABP9AQH8_9PSEU
MTTVQPPRHHAPAGAQGFGREPHPSGPVPVAPRVAHRRAAAPEVDAPTMPIPRAAIAAAAPVAPMGPVAPAAPRRRRRWPWIVGGLLLLLVIIVSTSPTTPSTPTPAAPTPAAASAAPSAAAPAQVTPPSGPATSFGDGTHVVGEDIEPGTYRTAGPADGGMGMCYWSRLRNTSGELDGIIANGVPTGPSTVTIRSGDAAFETTGCQTWTKTR